MSENTDRLRRQSRGGTVLVAGGLIALGFLVGIVLFGGAPTIVLLAGLLPAIVLYFGARARRASKAGDVLYDDELHTASLRAGTGSFTILFGTILVDDMGGFLPREHLHDSLFYVGTISYVGLLVYYTYVSGLLASDGEAPSDG